MNDINIWHNLQKTIIINRFFEEFENNIDQIDKNDKILIEIESVFDFLMDIFLTIHKKFNYKNLDLTYEFIKRNDSNFPSCLDQEFYL